MKMGDINRQTSTKDTSANDASTYDTLYFYLSESPPEAGTLNVYASLERDFLGVPFDFKIIGSSHYIHSEAYGFHELASCKSPGTDASPDVVTLPLTSDGDRRSHPYSGSLSRRTVIQSHDIECRAIIRDHPLSVFDADADYDVKYRFDEDAYTAIEIGDAHYETWHTYPEFDLALYTRTDFQEVTSV